MTFKEIKKKKNYDENLLQNVLKNYLFQHFQNIKQVRKN